MQTTIPVYFTLLYDVLYHAHSVVHRHVLSGQGHSSNVSSTVNTVRPMTVASREFGTVFQWKVGYHYFWRYSKFPHKALEKSRSTEASMPKIQLDLLRHFDTI